MAKRILYHGTSDKFRTEIEAKGLIPRKYHGNSTYAQIEYESRHNLVYLSDRFATFYADLATSTYGGRPMLIRLEIDEKFLYPDEDFLGVILARQQGLSAEEEKAIVPDLDPTKNKKHWQYSLQFMGTCSTKRVPKNAITHYYVFGEKDSDLMFATGWDSNPIAFARKGFPVSLLDGTPGRMSYTDALKILFEEGADVLRAKRNAMFEVQNKKMAEWLAKDKIENPDDY